MIVFMVVLSVILYASLVFISSLQPDNGTISLYELKRRQKLKDPKSADALRRIRVLSQAAAIKASFQAIGFVVLTSLLVYALGWTLGLISVLIMAVLVQHLASLQMVRRVAHTIYKKYEMTFLEIATQHEKKLRLLGGKPVTNNTPHDIASREELMHLVEKAAIFTDDDRRLIEGALSFKQRTVKQAMTPIRDVTTVAYTELLGPLVLDDLHKTGHTLFPVMKGSEVVGMLDSTEHSALHIKESMPVRAVMNTDILKIDQDTILEEALETLTGARQQLLIATDDTGQASGLLTLTAIVGALTGK